MREQGPVVVRHDARRGTVLGQEASATADGRREHGDDRSIQPVVAAHGLRRDVASELTGVARGWICMTGEMEPTSP